MLKILITASITFFIPVCASATSYTEAVEKQSKCKAAGELSKSFFGTTCEHLQTEAKKVQAQEKFKKISKEFSA